MNLILSYKILKPLKYAFATRFFRLFFLLVFIHFLSVNGQDESIDDLKTVVIDPGHGGKDGGAPGSRSKEKDIVLDISLRLGKMIEQKYPDVQVVYTRKTDILVPLDKRGEIANKAKADLFISIHTNGHTNKRPYGAETFVMGNSRSKENMEVARRENAVILIEDNYSERYEGFDPNSPESYIYFSLLQNAYLNQSLGLATEIQKQFKNRAKRLDRGVKQANFLVLWRTSMPSVLIEVGFISNLEEEKYLMSKAGKEQLATCIFNAFCSYKTKIDERNASLGHHETEEKSEPASPEPVAREEVKTEKLPEKDLPASQKIEFCVQIATSAKPVDTHPNNFKKHKNVERIQTSPNFYKYIVGRTSSYNEAQETLKKMRPDFKDAFVVGVINGKIVPSAEALKALNKN
ncbi:MAG: N-acetylmuramoyl-L-alanine amidase [Bacteroidales bacterium]|jgi:N-acetylmuramoyl-L-alanine amidase|nr:N-acetylmuramoyl-L-alanine amidase [Bacteroidales bacterium]